MNTNIIAPSPVARQLEFVTAALEADLTPYMLGVLDAEKGEICCPEAYFIWEGDLLAYVEGYEEVKGENATSKQIKGIVSRRILTDAQIEVEADEYEEDMLDREYHMRGEY